MFWLCVYVSHWRHRFSLLLAIIELFCFVPTAIINSYYRQINSLRHFVYNRPKLKSERQKHELSNAKPIVVIECFAEITIIILAAINSSYN